MISINPYVFGGFPNLYSASTDGVDEWVDYGSGASLATTSSYTASIWIKASSAPASVGYIFGRYNDGINKGWIIRMLSTGFIQYLHAPQDAAAPPRNIIANGVSMADNVWHHILVTFAAGVGSSLYIDNSLVASANTTTSGIASFAQKLVTGAQDYAPFPRPFAGKTFHAALWSQAADASQRNAIFAAKGNSLEGIMSGLVLAQNFPTGQAGYPTSNDYSGSGNNGTLTNMENTDINTDIPT